MMYLSTLLLYCLILIHYHSKSVLYNCYVWLSTSTVYNCTHSGLLLGFERSSSQLLWLPNHHDSHQPGLGSTLIYLSDPKNNHLTFFLGLFWFLSAFLSFFVSFVFLTVGPSVFLYFLLPQRRALSHLLSNMLPMQHDRHVHFIPVMKLSASHTQSDHIHVEGMLNGNIQVLTYPARACFWLMRSRWGGGGVLWRLGAVAVIKWSVGPAHPLCQFVERPLVHMGFITGLGGNQSGTIVFPLLLLKWNDIHVHTHTRTHTHKHVCTHTQWRMTEWNWVWSGNPFFLSA